MKENQSEGAGSFFIRLDTGDGIPFSKAKRKWGVKSLTFSTRYTKMWTLR